MKTLREPTSSLPVTGLVELYRQNIRLRSDEAAMQLLSRFTPYLAKWSRLLQYGSWDHRDKELRHFLKMMGSIDVDKTAQILCLRLKAYELVDIEQEVRVVFLDTILHSKSIRKYFRYALQKRIVKLLKDPLVFNFDQHVTTTDESISYEPVAEIDDLWVVGLTCGPGFDELTPDERRILQLHHHYGLTIDQTASKLNIGTATVSRVISKAKKVLAAYYARRR